MKQTQNELKILIFLPVTTVTTHLTIYSKKIKTFENLGLSYRNYRVLIQHMWNIGAKELNPEAGHAIEIQKVVRLVTTVTVKCPFTNSENS